MIETRRCGAGSLIKAGTGILTLNASDTYTGGTMVSGGTLYLTNSHALAGGTNLTVGAGVALVFGDTAAEAPMAEQSGPAVTAVPEPGTLVLLAAATALLTMAVRRLPGRSRRRGIE